MFEHLWVNAQQNLRIVGSNEKVGILENDLLNINFINIK